MSPRSEELMNGARRSLSAARTTLGTGHFFTSVHESYYAMLYAARAALSEEDRYAKTHSGIWRLFRQSFVKPGRFPDALVEPVDRIGEQRLAADYEALDLSEDQAREALGHAERFVAAVSDMIGGE